MKDLNDKKDKMSQLVEAAHATRCTSNEKVSSTKKSMGELGVRPSQIISFTEKYTQHQHAVNAQVSSFHEADHYNIEYV